MLQAFLKKVNHERTAKFFQAPLFATRKKYAFVGVGMHSLTNFYPVLRFFNISLKYICTRASDRSAQMSVLFPHCLFTHNLQDILNDAEIAGVFVCASPDAHYSLLTDLLKAGKNVFVEKPPCATLNELRGLIQLEKGQICKIGLQRRYWPGNKFARKRVRQAISYLYQFQTGPLPQGDPFTGLFIHPLDYIHFLFGDYTLNAFTNHTDNSGTTVQMHVTHGPGAANPVSGLLQISTHYSWNPASEILSVNAKDESLLIQYPASVSGRQRPARILNIPTERILNQPSVTKEYFAGSASMIPALEMNSLVTQGFYKEIETFLMLIEGNGKMPATPASDLDSLLHTYTIIEKIRNA
jgi:virulence factor